MQVRPEAGIESRLLRTARWLTNRPTPAGKSATKACQIRASTLSSTFGASFLVDVWCASAWLCTLRTSMLTAETRPSHPARTARRSSAKDTMESVADKSCKTPQPRVGGDEGGGEGGGCGCDGTIGGEGEGRGCSDGAGDSCAPATHAPRLKLEDDTGPVLGRICGPEVQGELRMNPLQSVHVSHPALHLGWQLASARRSGVHGPVATRGRASTRVLVGTVSIRRARP